MVNSMDRTLPVVSNKEPGTREIIHLAQDLDQRAVIRGKPRSSEGVPITDFSDIFSGASLAELRAPHSCDYGPGPLLGTRQWHRAVLKSKGTET